MRNENFLAEMIKQFSVNLCDKQFTHNYAVGYYELLKNVHVDNLLEIGIHEGSSMKSWSKIYPGANIFGVDINPNSMIIGPNSNIRTDIVDQGSPAQLLQYVEDRGVKFDVIIDDGSHIFNLSKISIESLFNHLNDNGAYIVEDISSVYAEIGGPQWPQQTLQDWHKYLEKIQDINYKFIDCRYDNPRYPGSWMVGITKKK